MIDTQVFFFFFPSTGPMEHRPTVILFKAHNVAIVLETCPHQKSFATTQSELITTSERWLDKSYIYSI